MILSNLTQYKQKGIFNNLNSPKYIIRASMNSQISIFNVTYSNSSLALFLSQQSTLIVSSLTVNNVSSFGFARIDNSVNSTLSDWNINSKISNDTLYLHDSYIYLINNIAITGIQKIALHFVNSNVDTVQNLNLTGISYNVISIEDSNIFNLSNSYFALNGQNSSSSQNNKGKSRTINGVIYVKNSNTTISESIFVNNS